MARSPKKQSNKSNTEKGVQKKTTSKVRTTKDIVREHLADENHKISEEDMKVEVDMSLPNDKAHEPLPITNDDERPKDVDKDHAIITPWNVINE